MDVSINIGEKRLLSTESLKCRSRSNGENLMNCTQSYGSLKSEQGQIEPCLFGTRIFSAYLPLKVKINMTKSKNSLNDSLHNMHGYAKLCLIVVSRRMQTLYFVHLTCY